MKNTVCRKSEIVATHYELLVLYKLRKNYVLLLHWVNFDQAYEKRIEFDKIVVFVSKTERNRTPVS